MRRLSGVSSAVESWAGRRAGAGRRGVSSSVDVEAGVVADDLVRLDFLPMMSKVVSIAGFDGW